MQVNPQLLKHLTVSQNTFNDLSNELFCFYFRCFVLLFSRARRKYPKEFKIGQFTYVITTKERYSHDDDFIATFFVVHKKVNKGNQVSSYKIGGHEGKRSTYGSYKIAERFIEFKEVYSDNATTYSMMKRFYPNKKGNLVLTEYTHYKDGNASRTKL